MGWQWVEFGLKPLVGGGWTGVGLGGLKFNLVW
jgi:hypothetical protein